MLAACSRPGGPSPLRPLPEPLRAAAVRAAHGCVAFNVAEIARAHPGAGRVDLGGATEDHIRIPAFTALGLAVLLRTGAYDGEAAGVSRAAAGACALRLIDSLTAAHVANGGTWGGDTLETVPLDPSMATRWQSSLWAWAAGLAGRLLSADLDADRRAAVRAMVTAEASRFLRYPVPYWTDPRGRALHPGDSKSEENAWHAGVLLLAVVLAPEDPRAAAWTAKAVELSASTASTPEDLTGNGRRHGVPLSSLVHGVNVEASGVLVNHGIVNPTYMASGPPQNAINGLVFAAATGLVPAACLHHLDLVHRAMSEVAFAAPPFAAPGGPIYRPGSAEVYYPADAEGDPGRMAPYCAFDVLAHCAGASARVPAATWAGRHLARQLEMQSVPGSPRRSNQDLAGMAYIVLAADVVDAGVVVSDGSVSDLVASARAGSGPLAAAP